MKCELIKKTKEYTNKNGEVKKATNFYLVFENGQYISIKACFNVDYFKLKTLATFDNGERSKE